MQLHVESVQAGFPDCIARQRVGGNERRIRIEFEFRSSSFRAHGHPTDGCDWIVCWEHDWNEVPPNITVVELRRYFGSGFNVWAVIGPPREARPARDKFLFGKPVSRGDLVLVYEGWPKRLFSEIYAVGHASSGRNTQFIDNVNAWVGNRKIWHCHAVRRLCTLEAPLPIKTIEAQCPAAAKAIFSGSFNRKITEHWWRIHEMIVRKNPGSVRLFEPFSPSKV